MSDPGKAVFLSYASQDAEAAKRICDALRAAGVEVWFDQSELVGGDAWDQKIRKQIKDCALLIPIISANTQSRTEGYFRLEWRLADQRTHLMAKGRAFLLPVVIDDTRDFDAHVPDSFTEVQWTRLKGGEGGTALAARVKKLLDGSNVGASLDDARGSIPPDGRRQAAPLQGRKRNLWLIPVILAAVFAGLWQQQRNRERPPVAVPPAVVSAASTELARIRARIIPDRWQKGDFDAVSPALDRLLQADPDNADAWAFRSIINSLQVVRILDPGTKPLEAGKVAAERALRLAPESPLANLALGLHLVAMVSRGGDPLASRESIDRAVATLPPDALTRYAELVSFWLGYDFEGTERRAQAWVEAEPKASYPVWILTSENVAKRRPAEVMKWGELAAADSDITGIRALTTMADAYFYLRADLPATRATLERIPLRGRSIPRVVYCRWLLAMAEHRWDEVLQDLAQVPDAFLFDLAYNGPKALLAGLAHQSAGRVEAAATQFREAERLLREKLAVDTDNEALRAALALTLACAGRAAEARSELALVEPLVKGRAPNVYRTRLVVSIAQAYGALADTGNLAVWLRKLLAEPSSMPVTPASLRYDPRFTGMLEAPEIQALLKEFASLDQPVVSPSSLSLTPSGPPQADQKSVAVLAFANLSDDKGNEYFSDGISEELLNVLAKVPGLKVTARTSSFHFKGKDTPIPEIAAQLGVAYVVEGSVRKSGDKVRITAQLIKADGGFHVWSETFTRDLKDIFAVQDEIAGLIAKNLELKMGTVEAARATAMVNPEAHQLYLEGKYFLNQFTVENARRAGTLLERTVRLDPSFAPAWAYLSLSGRLRGDYGETKQEVDEGYEVARRAAERAVALDPGLAVAYVARFEVQAGRDFDWKGAKESIRRALELAPTDATVLNSAARLAHTLGENDKAIDLGRRAVALDPVNPRVRVDYGFALRTARRFPEAVAEFRRISELSPAATWAHAGLAQIYLLQGRFDEAAMEADQEIPPWSRLFAQACARWGQKKTAEADAALQELMKSYGDVAAYQVALVYAFRGDPDQAFAWLDRAYRQRDPGLTWIKLDSYLAAVHTDSHWPAFLKKMGLADDQLK